MKKIINQTLCTITLVFLLAVAVVPAKAQFNNSILETGGLYTALAKDSYNNLYVTRAQAGTGGALYEVVKYINGTGAAVNIYSGLTHEAGDYPWGLAVASNGDIYISTDFSSSAGAVIKLTNTNDGEYAASTFLTGKYYAALAIDASDNLYTTEYNPGTVKYNVVKRPAGSTSGTVIYNAITAGAGYSYPTGLAVAPNGDVYVTDAYANTPAISDGGKITKLTAPSYAATTVNSGNYASSLAIDALGNLYSSENNGTGYKLVKYTNGAGAAATIYTPLHTNTFIYPWGIAVFNPYKIFVADGADDVYGGTVTKLQSILPNTTTIAATMITTTSATLNSVVDADGYNAKVSFVYGTSPTLAGATTTSATVGETVIFDAGDSNSSLNIMGLMPATKYYYRVSANNVNGTTTGAILNFTTNGPVPAISYATPYKLPIGIAANLAPVNSGGAVPATAYAQVNTLAGNAAAGSNNGTGTAASFSSPFGVATDAAGNIYLADHSGNLIRKVTPAGVVTTLAGSGAAGSTNGTGTAASFTNPAGLAADAAGNVYVAEYGGNVIRKITPTGVVSTFAGYGPAGSNNGNAVTATFNAPAGVVLDATGNLYVADAANNMIRMITPDGVVSTFAGSGAAGSTNGTGVAASFNNPLAIAIDFAGNLYVADYSGNLIRKITPAGVVTTLAGSGAAGSANATGTSASFKNPAGLIADAAGNIYVADAGNNMIRKITAGGVVTTLAGAVTAGNTNGIATVARFSSPHGLALNGSGTLYIGDFSNNRLRTVTLTGYSIAGTLPGGLAFAPATGIISGTPIAGSPATDYTVTAYNLSGSDDAIVNIEVLASPDISYTTPHTYSTGGPIAALIPTNSGGAVPAANYADVSTLAGSGVAGSANGTGAAATFTGLMNMATDAAGNIYAADYTANVIRKITPAGVATTLAGSGAAGNANGTGAAATFKTPFGIAVDAMGNVYVGDSGNHLIRKITPAGVVTTFAGSGGAGNLNGTGTAAKFNVPRGLVFDGAGNLYVADYSNNLIRKITPGGVVTTLAGSGSAGNANGTGTAASFAGPMALTTDGAGNIYVADNSNNLVRKITPGGVVTTLAGSGAAGSLNGTGTAASFSGPYALSADEFDNIYEADGNLLRRITPAGVTTTLAGSTSGFVNAAGTAARFNNPRGIATDGMGNLYVSDFTNHVVRKVLLTGYTISPALPAGLTLDSATGIISGTPTAASAATDYTVTAYNAIGTDAATVNIKVVVIVPPGLSYTTPNSFKAGMAIAPLSPAISGSAVPATIYSDVSTLAGSGAAGYANGTGAAATFTGLMSMATDAAGNVYAADYTANLIRKVTPAGVATTLAGSGAAGNANGTGVAATFKNPFGIAVDAIGNVYVGDSGNHLIRKITPAGVVTTFAGSGGAGNVNGTGTAAKFNVPRGLAFDGSGNLYVADYTNNLIRKITSAGVVTTLAGTGAAGNVNGMGTSASFNGPIALTTDEAGNVFVADNGNNLIRKITPGGVVTTLAGSGAAGSLNGTGTAASFTGPYALTTDGTNNIYEADGQLLRKITQAGVTTTLAGSASGFVNAPGTAAKFNNPRGIATDDMGNLYVSDFTNHVVRKVLLTGYSISPALPAGLAFDGTTGIISGTPTAASAATDYTVTAYNTSGSGTAIVNIEILAAPNISYTTPNVYNVNNAIDPLSPTNTGGPVPANSYSNVSTLAGSGVAGSANGTGASATFTGLMNMATDAAGNIYAADYTANVIRKITPAGVATTLAGSGTAGNANGTGTAASFKTPFGIAVDAAGNVYVGDSGNHLIRMITPAGVVTTFAGSGGAGNLNGTGTAAKFNVPRGLAFDAAGNLYVADYSNNLVRKITPAGVVTTLAGSGAAGNVNATGTAASFSGPMALTTDGAGNIYVADNSNNLIRKITPAGVVTTLAGSGTAGSANGTGTSASFSGPYALTADGADNIYEADGQLLRKITPAGVTTTLAGSTSGLMNGVGTAARFNNPRGVATDGLGNLYVSDFTNHLVRKVLLTGYSISPALPAGLTFNGSTGVISGTPTVTTGAVDYTVMAYNTTGSDATTVNITIIMPPAFVKMIAETPVEDGAPQVKQGLSPNGDGIGDVLEITNIGSYPDNTFQVITRDGALVYSVKGYDNVSKAFDGQSNINGRLQQAGTYFYQLEYKEKGTIKRKTGFILLKY